MAILESGLLNAKSVAKVSLWHPHWTRINELTHQRNRSNVNFAPKRFIKRTHSKRITLRHIRSPMVLVCCNSAVYLHGNKTRAVLWIQSLTGWKKQKQKKFKLCARFKNTAACSLISTNIEKRTRERRFSSHWTSPLWGFLDSRFLLNNLSRIV